VKEKGEVWNLNHILGKDTYESILNKIENNTKVIESSRKSLSSSMKPSDVFKNIIDGESEAFLKDRGILFT
jgi:hypothetical protein